MGCHGHPGDTRWAVCPAREKEGGSRCPDRARRGLINAGRAPPDPQRDSRNRIDSVLFLFYSTLNAACPLAAAAVTFAAVSPVEDTYTQQETQALPSVWVRDTPVGISLKKRKPLIWRSRGCFSCPCSRVRYPRSALCPQACRRPPNPRRRACCFVFSIPQG